MFKLLKEKLKNWMSKSKSEAEAQKEKRKKIKIKAPEKDEKIKFPKKEKAKSAKKEKQLEKKETAEKSPAQEKPAPESEKEKPTPQEPLEKSSFFKKKLTHEKFDELFSELELILLQNNVAVEVVEKIKLSLEEQLVGKPVSVSKLEQALKNSIEQTLINPPDIISEIKKTLIVKKPYVICFVGINGSGKTTTIAKLANFLKKNHLSICLAAADTFRAASIEQLQKHADSLNLHLIKKDYGADPASVGYDTIQYAKKHHIDVVLIDTAGRMQNKDSLMKELEKIIRVNTPDMRIFVGESITGNDATEQAKTFNETIGITGIILSKADVDEKGGTAISVSHVTKKPILFLGTGQGYDDLEVFDKQKLISKLFS